MPSRSPAARLAAVERASNEPGTAPGLRRWTARQTSAPRTSQPRLGFLRALPSLDFPKLDSKVLDLWPIATSLYLLLAAALCLFHLGAAGVMSMEGMVADGARHMLRTGEWVVPHVYGEIYTYKPGLAYWLAALPLAVWPAPTELQLRLPFAAAGVALGGFVLVAVGRLLGARTGLLCASATLGGGLFLQKVRLAEFDVVLAAGVGVAVTAACCNLAAVRARFTLWLVGYAGLLIGALAKGTPALIAYLPGLLLAGFATGRISRLLHRDHLVAALPCLAAGLGYLAAAWHVAGAAAFAQPLAEAQARGFGWSSEQLALTLAKPALIFVAFLPSSAVLPLLCCASRPRPRSSPCPQRLAGGAESLMLRASAAFLVAGVGGFVATSTHEMRYYLPLAAAVGLLAGTGLRVLAAEPRAMSRALRWTAIGVVVVAAAATGLSAAWPWPSLPMLVRVTLGLIAALALGTAAVSVGQLRPSGGLATCLVVASLCTAANEALANQPRRAATRSLAPVAAHFEPHLTPGATLWIRGPSDLAGKSASLYHYLGRPVRTFTRLTDVPGGGFFVLAGKEPAQLLRPIETTSSFRYCALARFEHPFRNYLLGRIGDCSLSASSG